MTLFSFLLGFGLISANINPAVAETYTQRTVLKEQEKTMIIPKVEKKIKKEKQKAPKVKKKKKKKNEVVERAKKKIGCPYVWGGTTSSGFDCSGFVSYCLSGKEGVRLGTTYTFMEWERTYDPKPGDICVSCSHCGIYVGKGQMIHASTYGVGVIKTAVRSNMIYVKHRK